MAIVGIPAQESERRLSDWYGTIGFGLVAIVAILAGIFTPEIYTFYKTMFVLGGLVAAFEAFLLTPMDRE